MESASSWLAQLGPSGHVAQAILFTVVGILAPITFIVARRASRHRYFRSLNARTFEIRKNWAEILSGTVPPESWRLDPLDREIVETIVLDRLDGAPPEEAEHLTDFLRQSGLLDIRTWEARQLRGWRRQAALVSLGRMRASEGIPALAESLEDADPDIRIAALRGLGQMDLPEAAEEILRRVVQSVLRVPTAPLQNALLHCCRSCPNLLLSYARRAEDNVRPLLARVLGELATPELDEQLLLLASDPLPEVRASAARALGLAKPGLALMALSNLAVDDLWFVRLRAVVALGELGEPRSIPVLIGTLCDPNRHVRLRSASALARLEGHLEEIMEQVTQTRDRYAQQAFASELERSGRLLGLVNHMLDPRMADVARAALLGVVRAGAHRMLIDALVHHPSWRIRMALARLLAASKDERLVAPLEQLERTIHSTRGRCAIRWIMQRLRDQTAPAAREDKVPA